MEANAGTTEKVGITPWHCLCLVITSSFQKLKRKFTEVGTKLSKIGRDDPRRIAHSVKVGLALTFVSIFFYVNPLFGCFGTSAMWAVLTVVVVMEYTVGGTLSKGLNRTFATLVAGALGLGAHRLAALSGDAGQPILLSAFVFLLAALATFSRFVPEIKARYDYGVTIFILTFSLVAVSSYRVDEVIELAHQRLSTIAVGVAICLFTSIFVFPIWAGEDLHNLVAANLEKLALFLEEFEGLCEEHFTENMESAQKLGNAPFLLSYKSVLNSKASEDSLANFARWEPGHGRFGFRHPWKQYLKIGALTRQCARSIEALHAYVSSPEKSQAITDPEFRKMIRSACAEMSSESGKALGVLAAAIRMMTPPSADKHLENCTAAAGIVKAAVTSKDASLPELLRTATTASLLLEVVSCTRHVATAVEELGRIAQFKVPEEAEKPGAVKPAPGDESAPHVVVEIDK